MDLFDHAKHPSVKPLAEEIRPTELDEVIGQDHLFGKNGPVTKMIESGKPGSIILQGPAGTGKTTIARIISEKSRLHQEQISAIMTGIPDLKKIFAEAERRLKETGKATLLFVDEIHRFNRSQQDAFLPVIESGTIVLIGATTENPSFEINGALLSRCRVLKTKALDSEALEKVLQRLEQIHGPLRLTPEAREVLIANSGGDARYLIGQAEGVIEQDREISVDDLSLLVRKKPVQHDKDRDGHYDLASAFQKSVRGSDPDAALYYAARMVRAGEDPAFIFRRLLVMASEEVAMADPAALATVVAARATFDMLGFPEGGYALAQAIVHVATAPKSNATYKAWKAALDLAEVTGDLSPPLHILNAPTKLMAQEGRKQGYQYDHDHPGAFSGQNFWPYDVVSQELYKPNPRGFEDKIKQRVDHWNSIRRAKKDEWS
jgi:putative ATPase